MIIEIKGAGCHNKGAEMMMLTIKEQLANKSILWTVAANNDCFYECYAKYGFYPKIWFKYKKINFGKVANYLPKKLRKMYGLIVDKEVDVILDASGFAYSSQWGIAPTKEMAKNVIDWKKQGKKIVLMPQAFGPFNDEEIKKYMKIIIENIDLIFARDEDSFGYLKEIKNDDKILLYPDFTILFKGKLPDYWNKDLEICIVPNIRMKDKRDDTQNYEKIFAKAIEYFQNNGLKPFFLIHGGKDDENLANSINNLLNKQIPIINEENPYYIKGIIANSKGLFGSRFHSLASALSSNVIAIGTGWSHKYQHLFKEYDFIDGLIDVNDDFKKIEKKLEVIVKQDSYILRKLNEKNRILEKKSFELFEIVRNEIYG